MTKAINQTTLANALDAAAKHEAGARACYTKAAEELLRAGVVLSNTVAVRASVIEYIQNKFGVTAHKSKSGIYAGTLTFAAGSDAEQCMTHIVRQIQGKPVNAASKAKQADPVAKFASAVKSAKSAGLTKAQALKAFERAWTA